ncbi:MAG: DUF4843 domain-containing protein [Odoribacteraceae bacterium]|nr:DUF4843 domain-containing protein [Odoribacteraceae bacterium]
MKYFAYIIIAVAVVACRKNEPMTFPDDAAIYFFEQESSGYGTMLSVAEKNFSFAILDDDVTEAEGKVNVRLLGKISDKERAFRARVIPDSTTAIEGTHYRLRDGILPAGELDSYLPVTLYRVPDLKQAAVNIYLEIVPTGDLAVGLESGQFFMLRVGDFFMKPASWTMFVDQYFGTYCDNKYKFIIDVLGITEFPMTRGNTPPVEGSYTPPQMQGFQYTLVTAYEQYRKTNPPIWVDDNVEPKVEIKFQP